MSLLIASRGDNPFLGGVAGDVGAALPEVISKEETGWQKAMRKATKVMEYQTRSVRNDEAP